MEYATLFLGILVVLCDPVENQVQAENSTAVSTEPVSNAHPGNHSQNQKQVDLINHFLLSAAEELTSSNANITSLAHNKDSSMKEYSTDKTKNGSLPSDNNTTPNEIHVIPGKSIPAAFSSVIDTLPVHPRIPRRSATRRKGARHENRHSTRVLLDQPVRILLPPLENEIPSDSNTENIPVSSSLETVHITPSTLGSPAVESVTDPASASQTSAVNSDHTEPSRPQYRKVFIPPPLRYLLPPFFYENYINAQPSTTQLTASENQPLGFSPENYYFPADLGNNTIIFSHNGSVQTSSIAPIIVIETVSLPNGEVDTWNYQIDLKIEHTTANSREHLNNESNREYQGEKQSPSTDLFAPTSSRPQLQNQFNEPLPDQGFKFGEQKTYGQNHSSRPKSPVPSENSNQQQFFSIQNDDGINDPFRDHKTPFIHNTHSGSTESVLPISVDDSFNGHKGSLFENPSTSTTSSVYKFGDDQKILSFENYPSQHPSQSSSEHYSFNPSSTVISSTDTSSHAQNIESIDNNYSKFPSSTQSTENYLHGQESQPLRNSSFTHMSSTPSSLSDTFFHELNAESFDNHPSRYINASPVPAQGNTFHGNKMQYFQNNNSRFTGSTPSTDRTFRGPKLPSFQNPSRYPNTSPTPTSTADSLPVLRGPNVEQTLFDTGNFYSPDRSVNSTEDSTLNMMDRPLLAEEVAQAGMKIMANMTEDIVMKGKLDRGRYRYKHMNQFNFQNQEDTKSKSLSKPVRLSVAETSYYNGRRPIKILQEADIRVIPGRPGKDYPTFTQPPTGSTFSCRSVEYHRGYVADPSTGCQVFYICVGNGPGEAMLCPNGTLFSQDFLVCDWWYNVDCQPST